MRLENYEIKRYDERNLTLGVFEDKTWNGGGKKPKNLGNDLKYVSKRHIGYYQRPEQVFEAIIDDRLMRFDWDDCSDLDELLDAIRDLRQDVARIGEKISIDIKEEVYP